MKLVIALVLLTAPVFAQDWRVAMRESIREAMRARVEATRAVREALRDAGRSWRSERRWRM